MNFTFYKYSISYSDFLPISSISSFLINVQHNHRMTLCTSSQFCLNIYILGIIHANKFFTRNDKLIGSII